MSTTSSASSSSRSTRSDEPATLADVGADALRRLLSRFGLELVLVADAASIPGSYWGEPEAGVEGVRVYARADTPVHSVLHEASHIICMSPTRRASLYRDAGGDELEESAVCYLQVCLADLIDGYDARRAMRDMDAWGYSFRLGSTRDWFERDADDARGWLRRHALIDDGDRPRFTLREEARS